MTAAAAFGGDASNPLPASFYLPFKSSQVNQTLVARYNGSALPGSNVGLDLRPGSSIGRATHYLPRAQIYRATAASEFWAATYEWLTAYGSIVSPVLGAQYTAQPAGASFVFSPVVAWPSRPGMAPAGLAVDAGRWWSSASGYSGVFYSWNFSSVQKAGVYDVTASHYSPASQRDTPQLFRCPLRLLGPWAEGLGSCRVYVWPSHLAALTAAAEDGPVAVAGQALRLTVHGWDSLGNAAWFMAGLPNDTMPLSLSSSEMSAAFRGSLTTQLVAADVSGPGGCNTTASCALNLTMWLDEAVPGKMDVNMTAAMAGTYSITFRDAHQVRLLACRLTAVPHQTCQHRTASWFEVGAHAAALGQLCSQRL